MKVLIVSISYHRMNTERVARAMAEATGATLMGVGEAQPDDLAAYDLVGFGSGIYHATFHPALIDLADRLPPAGNRRAFLFSTYGAPAVAAGGDFVSKNHRRMRERLQEKGYDVVGEFACAGWNTNVFLKYFGGLNKGRPDADGLGRAEAFARSLRENAR